MTDLTFDELMTRHEMGQAYKRITDTMGPNPQLLAFVNYVNHDQGNFGLESFDIMAQHASVLQSIDEDPSFELALEGLSDTLKSVGDAMADAGDSLWWDSSPGSKTGMAGSLLKKVGGAISTHSGKLEPQVHLHDDFANKQVEFEKAYAMEITALRALPKTFNLKDWKRFRSVCQEQMGLFNKGKVSSWSAAYRTKPHVHGVNDKVPLSKSGWTDSSYQAGGAWLKNSGKKMTEAAKACEQDVKRIEKWILTSDSGTSVKDSAESRKVMAIINETIGVSVRLFGVASHLLHEAEGIYKSVPTEKPAA